MTLILTMPSSGSALGSGIGDRTAGDTVAPTGADLERLWECGALEDPSELGPDTNPADGDRWGASGADLLTDIQVAQLRTLTSGLTTTLYGRYERVLEEAQRAVQEAARVIAAGTDDPTTTAAQPTVDDRRREEARALHALSVVSTAIRTEMGWE